MIKNIWGRNVLLPSSNHRYLIRYTLLRYLDRRIAIKNSTWLTPQVYGVSNVSIKSLSINSTPSISRTTEGIKNWGGGGGGLFWAQRVPVVAGYLFQFVVILRGFQDEVMRLDVYLVHTYDGRN